MSNALSTTRVFRSTEKANLTFRHDQASATTAKEREAGKGGHDRDIDAP